MRRHTLRCAGAELDLLDLGARVQALRIADASGEVRNVVLGHEDPSLYVGSAGFLGATIGRYANRIANGCCVLGGRELHLPANDRGNHLHGGPEGFDQQVWELGVGSDHEVTFRHLSPEGHAGYPGELDARVTYRLQATPAGAIVVEIVQSARSTARTIVGMTNHSYFNLDGTGLRTTIDQHLLRVIADAYTPVRPDGIPTGSIAPVAGSRFDFRTAAPLGPRGEMDHNLVLRGSGMRQVAELTSSLSGLRLRLATDRPGLQVYTGDAEGRAGIALEAQVFPDSPNQPGFPFEELAPGQEYVARIRWTFDSTAPQPNWSTLHSQRPSISSMRAASARERSP